MPRWNVGLMLLLLGALAVLEIIGLADHRFITITQIIREFVPVSIRFATIAWLLWHFVIIDIIK